MDLPYSWCRYRLHRDIIDRPCPSSTEEAFNMAATTRQQSQAPNVLPGMIIEPVITIYTKH